MTTRGDPKRTALVLVPRDLASIGQYLAELTRRKPREWPFTHNPGHIPGDRVLLGSFGPQGSGDLHVFVGMLTGCTYRPQDKTLAYQSVDRFRCPVIASYGKHVHREDLLGDRQAWGPNEFNYVLPAALTIVPAEAEALAKCLAMLDAP